MKLRKKVKLVQGTLALIVIAFIALITIGTISFMTSSKLNKYYINLSSNSVAAIENYGDLNGMLNELRIYVTRVIDRPYSQAQVNDVENADSKMNNIFKILKDSKLDSSQITALNQIQDNYKVYMGIYSDVKSKRQSGIQITPEQSKGFSAVGASITEGIKNAVTNEKTLITTQAKEYKSVSSSSNIAFLIVSLFSALLLLIISIIFVHELKLSLKEMTNTIRVISSGDFTSEIDISSDTEFGIMNKQLNIMRNSVAGLLRNITTVANIVGEESSTLSAVSEEMSASSLEVAQAINEVATGSTSQAGELMYVNAAIKDFGIALEEFVTITSVVNSTAGSIGSMASTSNGQLQGLITSLNNINSSFEGVISKIKQLEGSINQANDITGLINSISEQTNLLALNAAIEAARAGKAGRGFSVVADEIRKLAEQSKNSSDTIRGLLSNVSFETSNLVKTTGDVSTELNNEVITINTALNTFESIISSVETILPDIQKFTVGITKLNKDMLPVILKIENTSAVSEGNSASAEEISASTEEMKNSAGSIANTAQNLTGSALQLIEELNKFKL